MRPIRSCTLAQRRECQVAEEGFHRMATNAEGTRIPYFATDRFAEELGKLADECSSSSSDKLEQAAPVKSLFLLI